MNFNGIVDSLKDERNNAQRLYEHYQKQSEVAHRSFVNFRDIQEKIQNEKKCKHSYEYPNKNIDIETYLSKDMKKVIDYILQELEHSCEYINSCHHTFQMTLHGISEMFDYMLTTSKISDVDKKELSKASKYYNNMIPFLKETLKKAC